MPISPVPAWLTAWREGRVCRAAAAPVATPAAPAPITAPAPGVSRHTNPMGFSVPEPWACDNGQRREPVLDTDFNPPRVVSQVGWVSCLRCRTMFFSRDVVRLRLCDGEQGCRTNEDRYASGEPGGSYKQIRRDAG